MEEVEAGATLDLVHACRLVRIVLEFRLSDILTQHERGQGDVRRVKRGARVEALGTGRRERMPDYPETAHVALAPDWVCEVLSVSTRRLDLHGKRPVYAREGVAHLWLVDPADRALEAFELHDGRWVLIASAKDDDPVCIRPFDAITFSLGDLWP